VPKGVREKYLTSPSVEISSPDVDFPSPIEKDCFSLASGSFSVTSLIMSFGRAASAENLIPLGYALYGFIQFSYSDCVSDGCSLTFAAFGLSISEFFGVGSLVAFETQFTKLNAAKVRTIDVRYI
jgi:hypothetical protein